MAVAVVSDTSPLRAFRQVGLLPLLPALFERVIIPPAVVTELSVVLPGIEVLNIGEYPFLVVQAPGDTSAVRRLAERLGAGESEAIALALEIRPDYILIDEATGRKVAFDLGLRPLGVLGVIAELKRQRLIPKAAPLLARLRTELRFRLGAAMVEQFLKELGE